jgi:hypothetical protein
MSLKLDLFTAIALLGFELPADAHDIYSPLRDRLAVWMRDLLGGSDDLEGWRQRV